MKYLSMKKRIMFGVYVIFLMRRIKSPFMVEAVALLLSVGFLSALVSIPSVVYNMYHSGQFASYFLMAISGTEQIVKAILVLVAIACAVPLRRFIPRSFLKPAFGL